MFQMFQEPRVGLIAADISPAPESRPFPLIPEPELSFSPEELQQVLDYNLENAIKNAFIDKQYEDIIKLINPWYNRLFKRTRYGFLKLKEPINNTTKLRLANVTYYYAQSILLTNETRNELTDRAFFTLQWAADKTNHPFATYTVAKLYCEDKLILQNHEKAAEYFERYRNLIPSATGTAFADACYMLAYIYFYKKIGPDHSYPNNHEIRKLLITALENKEYPEGSKHNALALLEEHDRYVAQQQGLRPYSP